MARIEPKLRPSISVSDMSLLSKALDTEIRKRIAEGNKGLETLQVAKLKEYIDSFKPVETTMPDLLAKYTQTSEQITVVAGEIPSVSDLELVNTVQSISVLDDSTLTDEQKYDLLSLEDSKKYTAEEVAFMNNVGFMIKMQRMNKTNVREDEL